MSRTSPARPSAPRAAAAAGRGRPHTIRIIGGDWKRTPLPVLDVDGLRPTPDRVRETLFNWLGQDLEGRRCLDLFAGSGALGFEAASRGAASVVMVERHPRAAQQLRALKEKLAARAIEIAEADALRIAAGLAPGAFDVVFIDPPFGDAAALARALALAPDLVAPGGRLYVETGAPLDPAAHASLAGWQVCRHGKAGAVHYHLLQRENDE
ncbi:16S rRNA (guanine(966)-N(2))-methyltransferase RsmD [Burkholderia singularis]|uniref:16S rRNA (Guanine(966)-N(2))-methyltransferase RsmD n=1 Tax=Burkholderia singularis TaxID=1503053 RepID=A0A103E244_9BURK|nr:16S rRNA (guanine(966)-N(2))-methyltransferase RsmD [Burkholderia singularis]KVE26960.1 16S rRNA (guanine(966)-N(2))-methyltransferase RsmD [Burkholderia singularis]